MCDEWMPALTLPLAIEQFQQLPRHPAYKYEYFGGKAHLTPQPRFYHALLDLERLTGPAPLPENVALRPLQPADIGDLEHIFAAAFDRQQPYASIDAERRLQAAHEALIKVQSGGDGPWIAEASLVAVEKDVHAIGAIFITLLPDEDPADWESFHWREPPPEGCAGGIGRPHVTWIFVSPWHVGRGIGTALLTAAAAVLGTLGYRRLASTFLLGNESSMLWHWRNGFELQTYPASRRRR